MMNPKIKITDEAIIAKNDDAKRLLKAVKVFLKNIPPDDFIELSEFAQKKPELLKMGLQYKDMLNEL